MKVRRRSSRNRALRRCHRATITVRAAEAEDGVKRVGEATTVLNEMMGARGEAIPGAILEKP